MQHNTFAGASAKLYPVGNDFPTLAPGSPTSSNAAAGETTSCSRRACRTTHGTDGKDLGVDFAELNAAMSATAAPRPTPPPPPPAHSAPPPPSAARRPYSGTRGGPAGTVEFENYDGGGHDIAYYDTTASNTGGVYRSNAVDIQATTDTGGGYTSAGSTAGEWLKYTVNVAAAGTYAIDVRVASNGAGGTFHIEVNGVDKTGPLTVSEHRRLAGRQDGDEDRRRARGRPAGRPRRHGHERRDRLGRQLQLVGNSLVAVARFRAACIRHKGHRATQRNTILRVLCVLGVEYKPMEVRSALGQPTRRPERREVLSDARRVGADVAEAHARQRSHVDAAAVRRRRPRAPPRRP